MSTDVLAVRPDLRPRRQSAMGALGRKEAWRILTTPAIPILFGYLMLVMGIDFVAGGDEISGMRDRANLAEFTAYITLLLVGPITFVATHLVATSARRRGSDGLLAAAPFDQRRRDLALCLGVLVGPAAASLALAGLSAWLADGVVSAPGDQLTLDLGQAFGDYWVWTDLAQVPAIVLGAGILGVVVARWLPFPGSLLLGFVVLILGTGWLQSGGGASVRPWFSPYVAITWWSDEAWSLQGSQVWHLAYLLALSGLGVCAVAVRQPERRARWLAAGAVAVAVIVTTGLFQLPAMNS